MQSLTDMFMAKAVVIVSWVYAAAKSLQSCLTLSDPMDCSPPGSSIHGIFQATVLEWGAIAFSSWVYSYLQTHQVLSIKYVQLLYAGETSTK